MSNRFERKPERAGEGRASKSMMHLLSQMLMLPFTVFVYGMEMFVRTIKEIQRTTDQGMDVLAGGNVPRHDLLIDEVSRTHQMLERVFPDSNLQQGGWGDLESVTTTSTGNAGVEDTEDNQKERVPMTDRNLSDDQLKLVRFKILFVKRDYESAFREQEALVPDNMTGEAFTAWKVAEFIQELGRGQTQAPKEWETGDQGRPKYPKEEGHLEVRNNVWYLRSFPEKDKKYLRVYYEVLDRYVREEEDDEVVVLKEIRDAIHDRNARRAPAAQPAGGGGGRGRGGE